MQSGVVVTTGEQKLKADFFTIVIELELHFDLSESQAAIVLLERDLADIRCDVVKEYLKGIAPTDVTRLVLHPKNQRLRVGITEIVKDKTLCCPRLASELKLSKLAIPESSQAEDLSGFRVT